MLKKIADLCSLKGISITSLEKKLGFGNSTIMKWRDSSPSAEKLKKVADYFGVTVDYLLEEPEGQKE